VNIIPAVIYILFTAIIIAGVYVLPKYKWEVRRLASLDAIDEGIRSCVERGKKVHFSPGAADPTGSMTYSQTLPASLEVWRYICRIGGELNAPVIGSTESAATQLMMQDYARLGFTQAGHPERYDPRVVYYVAGGSLNIGTIGIVGIVRSENVGLHVSYGVFSGGSHLPVIAVANQIGAITIACNAYPMETSECALGADYPIIMEEEMASGVYLSGDPVQIASLLAEDFIKIGICIFVVVVMGLLFAGVIPPYRRPL